MRSRRASRGSAPPLNCGVRRMSEIRRALESLAEYFRAQGFRSEFRAWAMGDTVLVAGQPDPGGIVTVYRRMVYIGLRENGSWYTTVNGVDAGEDLTLEEVRCAVDVLMRTSDAEWQREFDRRVELIFPDRVPPQKEFE